MENLPDRAHLHHNPSVHHVDPVGHTRNHTEIVGYLQDGHSSFFLKLSKKVEYLSLNGHIQGSGRFVCNNQIRVAGESHGDHDPLALPAAQVVRVVVDSFLWRRNAHIVQQFNGPSPRPRWGLTCSWVVSTSSIW